MEGDHAGVALGRRVDESFDEPVAWALVASLVGLVVGAAAWALGVHSQNFQQSLVGRRAVLVSGLAALLIGAGPAIINFFYGAGLKVH